MEKIPSLLRKYFQIILDKTKELREDQNALIFLVFLVLSMGFWILNALRKDDYTTDVTYYMRLSNSKADELIRGERRRELNLKIKGGGFAILKYQLGDQFLIDAVDVAALPRVKHVGMEGAVVATRDYLQAIEGRLANGMELLNISPDTLFVPLVQKKTMKLPVEVNAEVSFGQQCQLSGDIYVEPDSVMVSGPQMLLDSLKFVSTTELEYKELRDTLVRSVSLESYPDVDIATKRVRVTIPVEPFTEAFLSVSVKAKNLPDSVRLKSFPSSVKVRYHIGLSRALYTVNDFEATIDFSDVELHQIPDRMKVKLNKFPDGISNMRYSPLFVEFLLEKGE